MTDWEAGIRSGSGNDGLGARVDVCAVVLELDPLRHELSLHDHTATGVDVRAGRRPRALVEAVDHAVAVTFETTMCLGVVTFDVIRCYLL